MNPTSRIAGVVFASVFFAVCANAAEVGLPYWVEQHWQTNRTLNAVYKVWVDGESGSNEVWAVGDHGLVLHTTNAGENWSEAGVGSDTTLTDVHFTYQAAYPTSADVFGWITGYVTSTHHPVLLRSSDNGTSWWPWDQNIFAAWDYWTPPDSSPLLKVKFITTDVGYITAANGGLIHTEDGGAYWQWSQTPTFGGPGLNSNWDAWPTGVEGWDWTVGGEYPSDPNVVVVCGDQWGPVNSTNEPVAFWSAGYLPGSRNYAWADITSVTGKVWQVVPPCGTMHICGTDAQIWEGVNSDPEHWDYRNWTWSQLPTSDLLPSSVWFAGNSTYTNYDVRKKLRYSVNVGSAGVKFKCSTYNGWYPRWEWPYHCYSGHYYDMKDVSYFEGNPSENTMFAPAWAVGTNGVILKSNSWPLYDPAQVSAVGGSGVVQVQVQFAFTYYNDYVYIYRATSPDGPWELKHTEEIPGNHPHPWGFTWDDDGVSYSIPYYYKVSLTATPAREIFEVVVATPYDLPSHTAPDVPSDFSAADILSDNGWKVRLTWSSQTEFCHLFRRIYELGPQREHEYPDSFSYIGCSTSEEFTDPNAMPGLQYEYHVRAYDGVCHSAAAAIAGSSEDNLPPSKVAALRGDYLPDYDCVYLRWDDVCDDLDGGVNTVGGYYANASLTYPPVAQDLNEGPMLFSARCFPAVSQWRGKTVYFRVRATDRSHNLGAYSEPVAIDVPRFGSSDASSIASNGARRLARTGAGSVWACWEGFGRVKCALSQSDSAWQFVRALDFGKTPTLALGPSELPWVAYIKTTDSTETLCAAVLRSDSTSWKHISICVAPSGQHLGPPSLEVFPNATGRIGNVCFPVYNASTSGSKIVYIQFDTCGNLKQNLVDSLPGSYADSFPVVSVTATDTISIVYQHSSNCYKRRLVYSPTTNSTIPDTWPGASALNSTQGPTIRYPFCERIGPRLWVTYSYEDQGDWVIKRVSCLDTGTTTTWEGEANLSNVDANPKYWPVLSTPAAVAWTESLETHCAIMANVSDSLLQLTGDTSCCYVSLLADTAIRETPSTNMTRIRYLWLQNYSGDTWTVPYAEKEVRVSDAEANVTRYNQGAKLAIASDDSLSSVYRTSQGSIYFCRQKDGDAGWSTSLLSSTGESPAVANDCHDRIWTCERDATSPAAHVIRCHNRATGSGTWQSFTVYSVSAVGQAGSRLGPPAIAACPNDSSGCHDAAYIAFTVYTSVPPKSTIVMAKVDTGGVIYYVDTLHSVASFNDSFPSVALAPVSTGPGYAIEVGWQNGTEVYTRKTTNYDHPEFTTKRTWSTAYNLSNTQTNSRHPLIAADSDTILVAWVEGDSGRILVKGQTATSAYNSWGDTVNVSLCPDSCTEYPGIALGDSDIVTYQKKLSSTNYDIIARVNFHSNLNLSNSSTKSTYDHSLFYLAGGTTPVITSVWTEELSANYAEVSFQRWELGQSGGGGEQGASVFDPGIKPMLYAPAPNPFNGLTNIRYQTNIRGLTRITVMDITGRRVRNLLTMPQKPGIYTLTWNARDDRERQLPRGVYFVRLETTNYNEARKLILTE